MPNFLDRLSPTVVHTCEWVNDDLSESDKQLLNAMTQQCSEFAKSEATVGHSGRDAARTDNATAIATRDEFVRLLNRKHGDSCKGCHPDPDVRHVINRAKLADCYSSQLPPDCPARQHCRFSRFLGKSLRGRKRFGRGALHAHSVRQQHVRPVIPQVNIKWAGEGLRNTYE